MPPGPFRVVQSAPGESSASLVMKNNGEPRPTRFPASLNILDVPAIGNASGTVVEARGDVAAAPALKGDVKVSGFRQHLQSEKLEAFTARAKIVRLLRRIFVGLLNMMESLEDELPVGCRYAHPSVFYRQDGSLAKPSA
jgi:hypothetical protein